MKSVYHHIPTAIIFLLLASGCTTTKSAIDYIGVNYVGNNIDKFIIDHGIPSKQYELNNGNIIYEWVSNIRSYGLSNTTTQNGHMTTSGNFTSTSISSGGGSLDVYCKLEFHTDPNGIILSAKSITDTIGRWTTSRCAEIFSF